jgi:uncharacterized Ntn-hydrolase superfamily protein
MYNPLTGIFSVWQSAFREATNTANRNLEVARTTFENVAEAVQEQADEAADETTEAMTAGREKRSTSHNTHSKRNHK